MCTALLQSCGSVLKVTILQLLLKSMKQILTTIIQVFHSRYLFKGKINLPKIFCKIFFLIYLVKCLTQHTPPLSREPVLWADGDGECDRASSKSSSSSLSCSLSVGDYNVMKDKISTVASFVLSSSRGFVFKNYKVPRFQFAHENTKITLSDSVGMF